MRVNAVMLAPAVLLAFLANFVQVQSASLVARTYRKTLEIVNKEVSPDGFKRMAVLADGVLPGPLIKANKGDDFKIKVVNNLKERSMHKTTSIHWHGLFVKGYNWADGPTFVNQCPIASGHSFEYEFPSDGHTNTFWYHSHHEDQYCDGLRGGLVIYDDDDLHKNMYDFDHENTVITLMDWFHVVPSSGTPNSTLINGKGRYAGGPAVDLAVVDVRQDKRYRMRLISLACVANFMFSIDEHELEVIETDGVNTESVKTNAIQILAGQRYSFILHANQPKSNYWIRALPNVRDTALNPFAGGINSAILRYAQAAKEEPAFIDPPPTVIPVSETALAPKLKPEAPGKPQLGSDDVHSVRLEVAFNRSNIPPFSINGHPYIAPEVPVLLQIMNGVVDPRQLLPADSIFVLPRNKTIEVTLVSVVTGGPHPFHLHGHTFSVVKGPNETEHNFKNPPRRDVYNSGSGQETVIRFVTDNAGPWLFHCHIEFHFAAGMGVVFVADLPNVAQLNPAPDAWKELCPIYDELTEEDL